MASSGYAVRRKLTHIYRMKALINRAWLSLHPFERDFVTRAAKAYPPGRKLAPWYGYENPETKEPK